MELLQMFLEPLQQTKKYMSLNPFYIMELLQIATPATL